MTHCSTETPSLASLGSRKLEADFAGGQLTSDAGALLLREADRDLGLLDALEEAIEDPRDERYVTHQGRDLLA